MLGPQGNQLGDEPGQVSNNARSLQHFDHIFKGSIHTIKGGPLQEAFGPCEFAQDRSIHISASAKSMEISEDQGWFIVQLFDSSFFHLNSTPIHTPSLPVKCNLITLILS